MASNTEFTHIINELIGVDTPFQLFCIEHKITDHRKLKDRWKEIRTLEYTDSTGTKVKLSDEDINEFMAIVPFKNYLQNELGLKKYHPLDLKQYSREDFLCYCDDQFFSIIVFKQNETRPQKIREYPTDETPAFTHGNARN